MNYTIFKLKINFKNILKKKKKIGAELGHAHFSKIFLEAKIHPNISNSLGGINFCKKNRPNAP